MSSFYIVNDFTGDIIQFQLPGPGEGVSRRVELLIPITDDEINEFQESFVGFIVLEQAVDFDTIQIGRGVTQLFIIDNDSETILI